MASKPLGYEKITDLSSAVGFTVPDGAKYAIVIAESQNVRWRDDGTDPTATDGMLIVAGGNITRFEVGNLALVRFIEVAASATLHVSYYKE